MESVILALADLVGSEIFILMINVHIQLMLIYFFRILH